MVTLPEFLWPAVAGILLYAVAWLVWRWLLSPSRSYELSAEKRARLLLEEFLTDEEGRQLVRSGHLLVRSPHQTDRVYRIPAEGRWVDVYDSGRLSMRICGRLPRTALAGDAMLAQKLLIEDSEDAYLRTAEVKWRHADGDGSGWRQVSNSNGRRGTAMLTKFEGGEAVKGGVYWSVKDGEFISVPKEGGVLEKESGRTYLKVPLPIVLVVGPIMGLAFAFFLPLSGVLVLASLAKRKLQGAFSAGKVGAAGMARLQMQPGASYLEPKAHEAGADAAPSPDAEDGKLVELAKEIAEKRWHEQ